MVDVRTGWLLGFIVGATACSVPNPLFLATGESTGDSAATEPDTTGEPATTGTSASATTEPASTSEPGTTTMSAAVCGNDAKELGEQCDDGNLIPGDGCEANCRLLFKDFTQDVDGSKGAVALAVADLDGANNDDLVLGFAACPIDQACIKTWHNLGDGTFALADEFPVGQPPARLFVSDWDGDAKADILATHAEGFISLVRGADPAPVELAMPGDLTAAIVARVDDDDFLDLVIPDELGVKIHYALANGTSFTQPNVATPTHGPRRLAAADVDGDGAQDVLYTIYSGSAGFAVKPDVTGQDLGPFTSQADNASPIVVGDFAALPPNVAYADPLGKTLHIFSKTNNPDQPFTNVSYTVATAAETLVLRSIRLNTPAVDNVVGLTTTMGLQVFTYDDVKKEVVAGTTYPFPGTPIDFVAGELGGKDGRPDIAALTTEGCYVMINQSGE